jgi:hypothetical protein
VDLGLSVPLPVNGATVLREPDRGEVEGLLDRVAGFFAAGSGGPYEIWSVWPLPSLDQAGVPSEAVPCMVRDPGGTAPEAPGELEIAEAVDEVTVRQAEALIAEVFGAEDVPGSMLTLACLDERFRVWIGRVEGRPVTTAAAFIGDGFVGIYAVATTRDARGARLRGGDDLGGDVVPSRAARHAPGEPDGPADLRADWVSDDRRVHRVGARTLSVCSIRRACSA